MGSVAIIQLDLGSGEPAFHALLGREWTPNENCIWLIHRVLDLPDPGGKWAGIESRPQLPWTQCRRGDIVVWGWHADEWIPGHVAVLVGPLQFFHSGVTEVSPEIPVAHYGNVRDGSYPWPNPRMRFYRGRWIW